MATVHVTISQVCSRSRTGATMPVLESIPSAAETLTSSGTSAQATITGSPTEFAASVFFWCVVSTGNVWVRFGPNPTAVSGQGYLVPAGVPCYFSVTGAAEKIAVKDA